VASVLVVSLVSVAGRAPSDGEKRCQRGDSVYRASNPLPSLYQAMTSVWGAAETGRYRWKGRACSQPAGLAGVI
jgi:hypothetical protein